jgi:hypothetical protein
MQAATHDIHTARTSAHCSRENNVHVFCIASHTSAWNQVGDVGPNRKLSGAYNRHASVWKRSHAGFLMSGKVRAVCHHCPLPTSTNIGIQQVMTKWQFNAVFAKAYAEYELALKAEFAATKANTVTRAFAYSGWWPLTKESQGWVEAIATFANEPEQAPEAGRPLQTMEAMEQQQHYDKLAETFMQTYWADQVKQVQAEQEVSRRVRASRAGFIPDTSTGLGCTAADNMRLLEQKQADIDQKATLMKANEKARRTKLTARTVVDAVAYAQFFRRTQQPDFTLAGCSKTKLEQVRVACCVCLHSRVRGWRWWWGRGSPCNAQWSCH